MSVKIPKIIVQTWETLEVPEKWSSCYQTLSHHHDLNNLTFSRKKLSKSLGVRSSDLASVRSSERSLASARWTYVLLSNQDRRDFVTKYFPEYLDVFNSLEHKVQEADMVRYMWLYVHGGVYMDLDYEVLKPLDDLFVYDADLYLIHSNNPGSSITNSFMASKPRCKFWLEVLEELADRVRNGREWWAKGKHLQVMMTTGPGMVQKVLNETQTPYMVLPTNLINNLGVKDMKKLPSQSQIDTYLYPLEGCSWGSWDSKLYNFTYQNWEMLLIIVLIVVIGLLVVLCVWFSRNYKVIKLSDNLEKTRWTDEV